MSNYYAKQDARVNLKGILEQQGWTIYGFKPDQSDCQSDYFSPADWCGIATKGKYIAVVDNKGRTGFEIILNSDEIQKHNSAVLNMTAKDKNKLEVLERIAKHATASEHEKENALDKINRLKSKTLDVVEIEIIKQSLNFPSTNYMIFIWDTVSQGIVYKSTDLTSFDYDDYGKNFEWLNGKAIPKKYNYRDCYDTPEKNERYKKEVEAKRADICKLINDFIDILNGIDNQKHCYRFSDTKKGTQLHFEKTEIGFLELDSNIYITDWSEQTYYKFIEYKEARGYNYDKRSYVMQKYAIFFRIKKDGTFTATEKKVTIKENDNKIFYKGTEKTAFAWLEQSRTLQIETETPAPKAPIECSYKVSINFELQGIEVKFDKKPDEKILTDLKAIGFRWSSFNKLWYNKLNDVNANNLKEVLSKCL